jgi:DNA polymerase-3 subunit delta'
VAGLACPDCHWFDQNSHPDVFRLAADDACTVDVARDINDFARTGAVRSSGRKYIIIERAETMTPEAANSLLKLLEEPPTGVIFFLLAERSQSVLATIRSRCQLIKLLPLSEQEMRQILEQQQIPSDQHDLILGLSLGRPGKALTLARGQLSEYQQIVPELLTWLRGDLNTSWQQLKSWLDQLTKTSDNAETRRSQMLTRLHYLELLLRDCVFFQIHSDTIVNQV